jgi:hypothetical protein
MTHWCNGHSSPLSKDLCNVDHVGRLQKVREGIGTPSVLLHNCVIMPTSRVPR